MSSRLDRLLENQQLEARLSDDELAVLQYLEDYGNADWPKLKKAVPAKETALAVLELLGKGFVKMAGTKYAITSKGFDKLPG